MIGIAEAFSPTYALARQKFLSACVSAGLRVAAHPHPLKGREGEELSLDVALDGDADAERLLIVSSACHGVEGHCGSGVQVFALHDAEWREKARAAKVAVLYLHALNPHGFSWSRRVTHENVDLNRNFVDFSRKLPVNAGYDALHPLLLPEEWPPSPKNQEAIAAWVAKHGAQAYQAAMMGGQYRHADGLFYGGDAPTWSNRTLRAVLRQHATAARRIGWIDLHTGLGPSGYGERMAAVGGDADAAARAKAWWDSPATPVTTAYGAAADAAFPLTGLIWNAPYEECPQAEFTAITMEYGTQPVDEVANALRGDHWLHQHAKKAAPELADTIRQRMRDAFYTDDDAWRGQIVSQARQAMFQAVDGLQR